MYDLQTSFQEKSDLLILWFNQEVITRAKYGIFRNLPPSLLPSANGRKSPEALATQHHCRVQTVKTLTERSRSEQHGRYSTLAPRRLFLDGNYLIMMSYANSSLMEQRLFSTLNKRITLANQIQRGWKMSTYQADWNIQRDWQMGRLLLIFFSLSRSELLSTEMKGRTQRISLRIPPSGLLFACLLVFLPAPWANRRLGRSAAFQCKTLAVGYRERRNSGTICWEYRAI